MSIQSCEFLNQELTNPNECLLIIHISPLVRRDKTLPQINPTVLYNVKDNELYCFKDSFSHKLLTLREIPTKSRDKQVLIDLPDAVGYVADCYKQFKEDTERWNTFIWT